MMHWHRPQLLRKPHTKKTRKKTEEDDFAISSKKTQPKKTPFSNRLVYPTFRSALTIGIIATIPPYRYEATNTPQKVAFCHGLLGRSPREARPFCFDH